jgi:hypothetical protein
LNHPQNFIFNSVILRVFWNSVEKIIFLNRKWTEVVVRRNLHLYNRRKIRWFFLVPSWYKKIPFSFKSSSMNSYRSEKKLDSILFFFSSYDEISLQHLKTASPSNEKKLQKKKRFCNLKAILPNLVKCSFCSKTHIIFVWDSPIQYSLSSTTKIYKKKSFLKENGNGKENNTNSKNQRRWWSESR